MAFTPDPAPSSGFTPDPKPDVVGEANKAANAQEHGPVQDFIDMVRAVPPHLLPALKGIVDNLKGDPLHDPDVAGNLHGLIHGITNPQETLSSISATLSSAGAAVRNATPEQVGANVIAPLVAGGAAGKLVGAAGSLASGGEAAAAEAATPAGQLGLRSTQPHPIATAAAGSSAGPTMDIYNQGVARQVLGADAGVPQGTPVNATSLAKAREAPGQLLDQGAAALPSTPALSDAAQAQVRAARGPGTLTKPTPNVEAQISGIENSLLSPSEPITGQLIRNTRNSLSSDANAGMNSTDADTRAIAKYKRNIVSALDQHIADTMPEGSAISPQMLAQAREASAKNYNLQDLIGKGGDIDLQALAKDHRDNPNKFTGNTATVAQFASDHPEVTGSISDATRISPPSTLSDLSHINILNPRSWVQPLIGGAGRAALRGPGAADVQAAGLGGEFEPRPLTGLSRPAGNMGEPPSRQPPLPLAPGQGQTPGITMQPPLGTAFEPHQPQLGLDPTQALPTNGIVSAPITQRLGDIIPGQRGAVGAPTDISGLRGVMNNPRTYTGMKPEELKALEDAIKKLQEQPRTYNGTPLGENF